MNTQFSNPVVMVIVLGALALAPFMLIMMTSFVKISVSLSFCAMPSAAAAGSAQPGHHRALVCPDSVRDGPDG